MFLSPDKILKIDVGKTTLSVKQKIIPNSLKAQKYVASYVQKGDPMKPVKKIGDNGKPKGITIHNTNTIVTASGTNPAEQYSRATYNGNMAGVVVHYYIYEDQIWQLLDESEQGWHASDGTSRSLDKRGGRTGGNVDTISIECIGDNSKSEMTTAMLAAHLCKKYGFDVYKDIYTHNYWMYGRDEMVSKAAKNCPYYILPSWNSFLNQIQGYLKNSEVPIIDKPTVKQREYTVKAGDSFWGIAQKELGRGSRYQEITELNKLSPQSLIMPGQKLILPDSSQDSNATDVKDNSSNVSGNSGYTIGDKVKIKPTATHYADGDVKIPLWVKVLKSHTVMQIRSDRVLLKEIYSWVLIKDITK